MDYNFGPSNVEKDNISAVLLVEVISITFY